MPLSPYVHRRIARRMQRPLPGTPSHHACLRIARRLEVPVPAAQAGWSPPALGELIVRIDTALRTRRLARSCAIATSAETAPWR